MPIVNRVADLHADITAWRRDLHAHPEIGFQELRTSGIVAGSLEALGIEVHRGIGKTGVVGVIRGKEHASGRMVGLRADMDALPIQETREVPYKSCKPGVMHACGHDIHMSVCMGTVRSLVSLKNEWKGTLIIVAQQAEEVSGGSSKAIESGLFSKFPIPDCALAFHINPELESGTVGLVGGTVFAGVKTVEIVVYGKGGHGAYPEKCIDPIVIASRIVLDLQTIVSREMSPLEPVVVTVGSIHGGTRPNIIPDEVKLELSLRYYSVEAIEKVIVAIRRICRAASQMAGMPDTKLPDVKVLPVETPPVVNNSKLSEKLQGFATEIIGSQNVLNVKPSMVAEDFGKYGLTPERVPICLIWLGSTSHDLLKELDAKGEKPAPLHSPVLNPDYAKTIETGILVMTNNVIRLAKKN